MLFSLVSPSHKSLKLLAAYSSRRQRASTIINSEGGSSHNDRPSQRLSRDDARRQGTVLPQEDVLCGVSLGILTKA